MMLKKIVSYIVMASLALSLIPATVSAAIKPTFSLSNSGSDGVQMTINGDALSAVKLSYLPDGASAIVTRDFGSTNNNGVFTTTISSGGYGIPSGSAVYVTVNGMQSSTQLWPSYTSTLSLPQTSIQLSPGQSTTISAQQQLILASNSQAGVVSVSINGTQATFTGVSNGSSAIVLCGSGVGCKTVTVTVGTSTQTQVSLSATSISMSAGESKTVYAYGGGNTGFTVKSNTNTGIVEVYTSGSSSAISLYGGRTSGVATIEICAKSNSSNCATFTVNNSVPEMSLLSFGLNNFTIKPNEVRTVIVSGGVDNNYFVSSNSLSSAVGAVVSSNVVTLTGGTQNGTASIVICSSSVSGRCGTLSVTLTNSGQSTGSSITFSQNVISVPALSTATITVSGGNTSSYVIGANSNSYVVTPSITSGSNTVYLYGSNQGTSLVTVCTASSSQVCANIFVTVTAPSVPVTTTESVVTLTPGGNRIVSLTGSGSKTITSNSNPGLVSANLGSNGAVVVLSASQSTGYSVITICASNETSNCTTLRVDVSGSVITTPVTTIPTVPTPTAPTPSTSAVHALQYGRSFDPAASIAAAPSISADKRLLNTTNTILCTSDTLIRASSPAVYYCGADGRRYVFPNPKTYATWYPNFNSVIKISDSQLGSIPIGGNVLYRPGVRLIKITTDPKVYAVAPNGVLRWVTSASIATKYYGADWNKKIDDVPDAFFTNYTIGADIVE